MDDEKLTELARELGRTLLDDSNDPLLLPMQPLHEDGSPDGPLLTTKGEQRSYWVRLDAVKRSL